MSRIPHVALLVETSNAYCRALLEGVAAYLRDNRPWSVFLAEHERGAPVPTWLRRWKGDGVIARVENEMIAKALLELEVPVVNVSSTNLIPDMHAVVTSEQSMCRLSFEHLYERGFRSFAFCGTPTYAWSISREKVFSRLTEEAGCSCCIFRPPATRSKHPNWEVGQDLLVEWLQDLPKPAGLLASHDFRGQQVLDACRRAEVSVPEHVAVISLGNDELLCNLTSPPMTSVKTNAHGVGYKAASMLDRLVPGMPVDPRVAEVEPVGVCTRQSTDIVAIEDPDIATALQMIRREACDGIKVTKILESIPMSRRAFEALFKKLVGRTAHEEILRVKLAHAKRLLAESELSLTQVAHRTGFTHTSYMSEVFRKKIGLSPSKYREEFHGK